MNEQGNRCMCSLIDDVPPFSECASKKIRSAPHRPRRWDCCRSMTRLKSRRPAPNTQKCARNLTLIGGSRNRPCTLRLGGSTLIPPADTRGRNRSTPAAYRTESAPHSPFRRLATTFRHDLPRATTGALEAVAGPRALYRAARIYSR